MHNNLTTLFLPRVLTPAYRAGHRLKFSETGDQGRLCPTTTADFFRVHVYWLSI